MNTALHPADAAGKVDDLLGPHPPEVVALIQWLREQDLSRRTRTRRGSRTPPAQLAGDLRVA
jgi:hypothetical protein